MTVCKYCGIEDSVLHECDMEDLKDNIEELAELVEDQTQIIADLLQGEAGVH